MNVNIIAEIQGGYMHNRKVRKKFPTKFRGLFYNLHVATSAMVT